MFLIIIHFLKIFILFLSIQIVVKEIFHLYKCIKAKISYEIVSKDLLFFGLSVSYILTIIFF